MKNVLIKADYSGQELRILAEISQDKEMINAFNNGLDLHLLTANRVFNLGLDTEVLTSGTEAHNQASKQFATERYKTKAVNFGIIYGQTKWGLANGLNITLEEAQTIIDGFFDLYPGVYNYLENIKKQLWDKGYVCTLMGRKRRFPQYRGLKEEYNTIRTYNKRKKELRSLIGSMERQAGNTPIQGTAADMLKIAMNKIRPKLSKYDGIYVLIVHDEIVVECPKETSEVGLKADDVSLSPSCGLNAQACAAMIKETMEHCVRLSVPITVDVDIVNTYGD